MKRDANDILCEEGEEALRASFDEAAREPYRSKASVERDILDLSKNPEPAGDEEPDPGRWDHDTLAQPEPTKRERFPLICFGDLKPGSERSYLVKGVLPRIGLATVWGPPKCGKSFWVFDLMLHVAQGWQYRDRLTQQGAVVYSAFEGAEGFKARAEAFRRKHDPDADVQFYLMPMRLDLVKDHQALIQSIQEQIGTVSPVAVVLDTLNRSLAGSESSDEDMSAYINAADAIRRFFDCLVIIIHHCGIDASRPRGHTSLTGAIDAQIAVKRDRGTGIVTCTVEWMKDGPEGAEIASLLEAVVVGTDADGDEITSLVVVPCDITIPKSIRPAGHAGEAYDCLIDLLNDNPRKPPPECNVPQRDMPVVPIQEWRERFYDRSVAVRDIQETQDTLKKRFQRAAEKLKQLRVIGIDKGFVWVTKRDKRDIGGHSGHVPGKY